MLYLVIVRSINISIEYCVLIVYNNVIGFSDTCLCLKRVGQNYFYFRKKREVPFIFLFLFIAAELWMSQVFE